MLHVKHGYFFSFNKSKIVFWFCPCRWSGPWLNLRIVKNWPLSFVKKIIFKSKYFYWALPPVWILISRRSLLLRVTKTFPTSYILPTRNYVISFVFAKEVEKLLRNMNIYKSPGPDCISPRKFSSVVIFAGFISEYIFLSNSTAMYMEVGPHHSSSQEREQKSYRQLPSNITDLYRMQDCRSCGKDPCGRLLLRNQSF